MQLNEKITDSKLSRRTVVKAGAWAVPVVAAAVAVPMAAASVTLTSMGGLTFFQDGGAGTVTLSNISFGINGVGTPGAPQATGSISIRIDSPNSYVLNIQDGEDLGNGWIASVAAHPTNQNKTRLVLTYAPGLELSSQGSAVVPQLAKPVVYTGQPNSTPSVLAFGYRDSWANFPSWGTSAQWPADD